MADWNEHVLNVRARLDKASKQEMLDSVRYVFTEGANIDFNNKENLRGLHDLADVMRKIFTAAGKTDIDFAEMIKLPGPDLFNGLKEAVKDFESVWNSVIENMGSYSLKDAFMEDASGISMALQRITDKNGKIIKANVKDIQRAFKEISTSDQTKLFDSLEAAEKSIKGARTWEARTAAALEYVNVYERIIKLTDGNIAALDVERRLMPFAKESLNKDHKVAGMYSVDSLREAMPQMQTSLQNVFNMALGKPLIGLLEDGRINLEFAPVVIKQLDTGDLFKKPLKEPVKVSVAPVVETPDDGIGEIDEDFKAKLIEIQDALANARHRIARELKEGLLSNVPEDMKRGLEQQLDQVLSKTIVKDDDYNKLWEQFGPYVRTGTGTGDGPGSGDASSSEIESLRQQLEEANRRREEAELAERVAQENATAERHATEAAEEKAEMYRGAMDSMQEEIDSLRGQLTGAGGGTGGGSGVGAGQTDGAATGEVDNLENVRAKVAEITTAVEAKTTAFQNEKTTVGTVVDEEVKKLNELEEKVKSITTTISGLLNNIKNGESNLGEALNNIVVNVNYPKTEGDEQNKTSVEGLKTMLQDITYKVKLSKSDTDKNANKIALDESALEKTLRKVFVNIPSAKEPQEQTRENYALDSTLKAVNGTLETISGYTNSISSRVSQNTEGATHEFKSSVISIESVLKAIRDKMPRGVKTPSATNKQTGSKTSGTAFSIDKKETQKLALKKFRTELETTGRLTDDLKKKIRGLAISLGMVKDKEGFARWNEKFKQQKLSVGINDLNAKEGRIYDIQIEAEAIKELIGLYEELGRAQALGDKNESSRLRGEIGSKRAGLTSVDYATDMKFKHAKDKGFNAASTKAENSALAEQAVTVKRLNALYQQYGVLVERAAFAEGYLKDELESQKKAKNDEILALSNSLDVITPEMLAGFDASFARGKKIESDKQYSALAKKMDADEETRLKNIAKLEKEIAILRADSDSATNDGVRNALNEEIKLREELIELQKQDLAMEAQDEAYYRKRLANDTKLAKSNAVASLKERRRVLNEREKEDEKIWKQQVKDIQREHGVNAADSMYKSANDSVIKTVGAQGVSEDIQAKAQELSKQNKALRKLRNEIAEKGGKAEQKDRDALSEQINKVKKLKTEVDGYLKIHEKYSGDNATQFNDVDTSGFGSVGSDQYWKNITAAIKGATAGKATIKGLNADTGELTGTTKIAAHTFEEWSATVDPVTGKLSMLRTGIKKTETFIESVTRKTKEIFSYFSGSSIIFKAFNELKKGVQYVRDIDLALTELKKVTDETEETYRKFLDTASKTAAKVGSTIKDVVSSTADWARLGYSMKEAAEFAESTQILMNVSEFTDVSQATDTLISAVQAFGYTAETSMDVVDLLNTIGKIIAYR